MPQLSDDAVHGPLMSVAEVAARIAAEVRPVAEVEDVPLREADGRVLARDCPASLPLPPFDNAAVDGYAVRHADLTASGETRLPVRGRVAAGQDAGSGPMSGVAVRIFTGAPMPAGTDTVFMQEDVRIEGEAVVLPLGLKPGANRRLAGEDLPVGEIALRAGRRLRPQDIALAAAQGWTHLPVRRRLRVALVSTGDELTEPGTPLPPAGIYDSNRALLAALLTRAGCVVADRGILRDGRDAIAAALAEAGRDSDLVLTSGGVSTGEEDHVKAALEVSGRLDLWRMAIKPGRPVVMGRLGAARFVGLPGNPVAVFVTFVHIVRPLLAALSGAAPEPVLAVPARAAFPYRKKAGRREYARVTLHASAEGTLEARLYPREGAGVLTSLTQTDGLMEIAETITQVTPGDVLPVLPYRALV